MEWCATALVAITRLRAEDATIVAVERAPGAQPYWSSPALEARPLALVLGHEREGVTSGVLDLADAVVEVPMLGAGASLNVAVAAAVVLYEIVRRRVLGRGEAFAVGHETAHP